MANELVCTNCWRWYDTGSVCKVCKGPLSYGGRGIPAEPVPPPGMAAGGDPPSMSGYPGGMPGMPPMSGYPGGMPAMPPSGYPGQEAAPAPGAPATYSHPAPGPVVPRDVSVTAPRHPGSNPAAPQALPPVPTYESEVALPPAPRIDALPGQDAGWAERVVPQPASLSAARTVPGFDPSPVSVHPAPPGRGPAVYSESNGNSWDGATVPQPGGAAPTWEGTPWPGIMPGQAASEVSTGVRDQRAGSLISGAAGAVLAGLLLAGLWAAAASLTGVEMAPVAIVVGAGTGLALRRCGPFGSRVPAGAVAAGVALIAIALGGLFAGVGVATHLDGSNLLVGIATLDRSYLPIIWEEAGTLGVICGVLGVAAAAAAVLVPRRPLGRQ